MFFFNQDKFDFWEIYESIKRYYPIGIKKDESKMFHSYPGMKDLEEIIVHKIHNEQQFGEWENFKKEIGDSIQKPIIGTTYGQAPSFSSFIEIDSIAFDNFTRSKVLHFFVSVIGPFYTIIGEDVSIVKVKEWNFRSTNLLIVSPEEEYLDSFLFLCNQIENRFKGYRFVPFEICKQTIEGLDVRYVDDNLNSIFNALFNNHINLNVWTLGNRYYKIEEWLKKGFGDNEKRWTSRPLTDKDFGN
jgi:hypothetical protein